MLDALADLLGAHGRLLEGAFGKDESEFFAAVAAGDIFGADGAQEISPTAAKAWSPAAVSEGVVVAFEVVEIEHHHGKGPMFRRAE